MLSLLLFSNFFVMSSLDINQFYNVFYVIYNLVYLFTIFSIIHYRINIGSSPIYDTKLVQCDSQTCIQSITNIPHTFIHPNIYSCHYPTRVARGLNQQAMIATHIKALYRLRLTPCDILPYTRTRTYKIQTYILTSIYSRLCPEGVNRDYSCQHALILIYITTLNRNKHPHCSKSLYTCTITNILQSYINTDIYSHLCPERVGRVIRNATILTNLSQATFCELSSVGSTSHLSLSLNISVTYTPRPRKFIHVHNNKSKTEYVLRLPVLRPSLYCFKIRFK